MSSLDWPPVSALDCLAAVAVGTTVCVRCGSEKVTIPHFVGYNGKFVTRCFACRTAKIITTSILDMYKDKQLENNCKKPNPFRCAHGKQKINCKLCSKVFNCVYCKYSSTKNYLAKHMKNMHGLGGNLTCSLCDCKDACKLYSVGATLVCKMCHRKSVRCRRWYRCPK